MFGCWQCANYLLILAWWLFFMNTAENLLSFKIWIRWSCSFFLDPSSLLYTLTHVTARCFDTCVSQHLQQVDTYSHIRPLQAPPPFQPKGIIKNWHPISVYKHSSWGGDESHQTTCLEQDTNFGFMNHTQHRQHCGDSWVVPKTKTIYFQYEKKFYKFGQKSKILV